MFYEYKHVCPDCGEEWSEKSLTKKSAFESKTCYGCKTKSINDMTGFYQDKSCGNCKFFNPIGSEGTWGKCRKGYTLANEEEYTLTHAIENIDRCEIEEQYYDDFKNDVKDLVHNDCYCEEYEEEGDGH